MTSVRYWLAVSILPATLAGLVGCSDSPRPYGERTTAPPAGAKSPDGTPAPTDAPPPGAAPGSAPSSSAPPVAPSATVDVESKKGTDTGMIGGASGTTASGGKPGQGTQEGAGTPAVSSGDQTENKK